MPPKRKVVETVTSGAAEVVREVVIHDTTVEHIREDHPNEYARWPDVVGTIAAPTHVHRSKTRESSVTFLNERVTSRRGHPLRVAVKLVGDGTGIMSTAHFSKSKDRGELLWSEADTATEPEKPNE